MTAPVWKATSAADYVLSQWDDQVVLYHRPSGLTHFVNTSTARLLTDLSGHSGEIEELINRYALAQELADPARVRDYVIQVLVRLEELGLVERVRGANEG